ncbi:hypothetical protein HZH68_016165 [Vespula germanica]|uniref:Uncharacterized protein n=1 Tax=Vespula germanica TaxID=30212 RepID=A0A834MQS7_VESGE|nr:hypothetical protein HZH68_016165 [Vespula germanica]
MALTFAEALVVYPPSVPSRCIEKRPCDDPACPPCPPCLPRSPCTPTCGQSSVQFQLTYTCDSCGEARRTSTLPPPCCHTRPAPFCCPKDGCPPMQQCPPKRRCPPPTCLPLICRERPCSPPPPPTICVAGPCPIRPCRVKYECPPPKIEAPPSCVRFCIRCTCEGSTYAPCYFSCLSTCPRIDCC